VKIERAISLAPSLTEMIFAVGAGDKLVGVTTYCNYPGETATIEKVGDTQTPNIEKIIALRPQVVFVSTASQLESFTKTLEEQGIAVFVSNPKSLDELFRALVQLGELFGTKGNAEKFVSDLESRATRVKEASERRIASRVFVQISNDPLFTIGRDSFLTQALEHAGGISVTNDVPTAYPKLSKETASALDPEVIILSDSDDNKEPNAVFRNSAAVKNGRVFRINADIISRPGPRLVDAIEEIARDLNSTN
jgi:iron complex transport system substrate-binding protein